MISGDPMAVILPLLLPGLLIAWPHYTYPHEFPHQSIIFSTQHRRCAISKAVCVCDLIVSESIWSQHCHLIWKLYKVTFWSLTVLWWTWLSPLSLSLSLSISCSGWYSYFCDFFWWQQFIQGICHPRFTGLMDLVEIDTQKTIFTSATVAVS